MNRESIFSMRLTADERRTLNDLARAVNRKPGELMRELLRNHAVQIAARKRGNTAHEVTAKN